jgi:hypothetical protein
MMQLHSRPWWLAGSFAVAAAAAALVTQTAGIAAVGGLAGTVAARPAAGAAAAAGDSRRALEVLLITGERVLAVPAAGGPVSGWVIPGSAGGLAGSVVSLRLGGQAYEIPDAALPYLGQGLDPGLFRLGALLSRESGGRLPVRIGYRGQLPMLPGVTVTSTGRGSALGYLTAASARAFGAALDRQYLADHARGSYGTDGMFAGGVSIALAGTAAPQPRMTPRYPMSTLTVTGTSTAGKPDTGDEVVVINADNSDRFVNPNNSISIFYHGTAKFSVPTGHYWAVALFIDVAKNKTTADRLDVLPQFTVAGKTTVSMTARAATSKITMVTPRRAQVIETDFNVLRGGQSGPPVGIGLSGPDPVWVSPVSTPPTVGTLHAYATQVLYSPPGKGVPFQYALEYGDPPGTIPPQRYVVRPEDVATVRESYYQTQRSLSLWMVFGEMPDGSGLVGLLGGPTVPSRNILFAGGNLPSLTWQRQYASFRVAGSALAFEGGQVQGFVPLPGGAHLREGWGQYPLHPNANANLAPANVGNPMQPSATRSGNTLRIDTFPFTDNRPGDQGLGFVKLGGGARSTGSYEIDQDGRKIAAGSAVTIFEGFPNGDFSTHVVLSPKPSVIKVTLTAAVAGPDFALSTSSRTVWTWRSAYQPAARLPQGWYCLRDPVTSLLENKDCAVQPMMTLLYNVHAMALDGSAPAGRQVIGVTVGHLQLARSARINGVRVSVSFDDGKTWHPAAVTRVGGGQFTAAFTAPVGAYVMLRTSAADAGGGSITETITRAYKIGS